jgi:hypothetical protein
VPPVLVVVPPELVVPPLPPLLLGPVQSGRLKRRAAPSKRTPVFMGSVPPEGYVR